MNRIGRWTYQPYCKAWKLDGHSWFLQARSVLDHESPRWRRGMWCWQCLGPPYRRYRLYTVPPHAYLSWKPAPGRDPLPFSPVTVWRWRRYPPDAWETYRNPDQGQCTHQRLLRDAMRVAENSLPREALRALNRWAERRCREQEDIMDALAGGNSRWLSAGKNRAK
jgi:hypothetical protein